MIGEAGERALRVDGRVYGDEWLSVRESKGDCMRVEG